MDVANGIIGIAQSFDLDAQIVGYVESSDTNKLTIDSPDEVLVY